MKKKIRKLRWDNIIKDVSVLAVIATIVTLVIVSCQHTKAAATVEEEPTQAETDLLCFKYSEEVPLPYDLQTYINNVCLRYEIAPEIVFAMIGKESSHNYKEIGDNGNSEGLMQVQRKHHEDRMDKLGCIDLLNPYENVLVGVDYLAELLTQYEGNMANALTAYNAGPTGAYEDFFSQDIEASEYAEEVIANSKKIDEGAVLVFFRTDDPVADFERYDAEQVAELEKLPRCSECDEPIQTEKCYEFNGELICQECLENYHEKDTEDYVE